MRDGNQSWTPDGSDPASVSEIERVGREMDSALAAYRRKMKAEQLALVEKQYLQKRLLEEFRVPRLSLFYLS